MPSPRRRITIGLTQDRKHAMETTDWFVLAGFLGERKG
jgi:hypothetical protein